VRGIVHGQVPGGTVNRMTVLAPVRRPDRQRLREGRIAARRVPSAEASRLLARGSTPLCPPVAPDSGTVTGTSMRSSRPLARVCRPTQAGHDVPRHHGASSAGYSALCRGEGPLARRRDIVSRDTQAHVQVESRHGVGAGSREQAAAHRSRRQTAAAAAYFAFATSHSLILVSALPEASVLPSGL
jgi:hypothetical protein